MDALAAQLTACEPVTLLDLEERAGLLTRTDRKYVVGSDRLEEVLDHIGTSLRVLDVDGQRRFAYESVYFDTPDLASFLGAARGRRRRFKVRTRTYVDAGRCLLEVKVRNGRDQTVKHRIEHPVDRRTELTDVGRAFVAEHVTLPRSGRELAPILTTRYHRSTLVGDGVRATIDADLRCTRADGTELVVPDVVIVETKSSGPAGQVDRALWSLGIRPMSCSKYALGMVALDPTLPANRWRRLVERLTPGLVVLPSEHRPSLPPTSTPRSIP